MERDFRLTSRTWVVLALALALAIPGLAQTSRGTLTGTVTDPTGAVVANAAVTISNAANGTSRSTTSNSAGIYRFDAVDLGVYDVSVKAKGFAESKAVGVNVPAVVVTALDIALKVGASTETVTVEATRQEVLQTTEQVRGGNYTPRTIQNIPLAGLDSLAVLTLIPGVTTPTTSFSNGTFNFVVNGQRPRGNNFMIDGVENNDISVAGPANTITNYNAVQEVSVQTTNFTAEFGRAGGAVINQVTKSGTNSFHGNVEHYYLSNAFNATSNDDRLGGLKHPAKYVENIPDFTAGGPVIIPGLYNGKNKTFWFAAGQWDRQYQGGQLNIRVPTASGFATLQALASSCPNVATYLQALGPIRGGDTLSPTTISIAAPAGTTTCNGTLRTGQSITTGLFSRIEAEPFLDNNHIIRIDHVVSAKQNMTFRWLYDDSIQTPNGLASLPGFDNAFKGRTLSGTWADTYVLSPSWTNEFRFNYGRINFGFPSAAPDAFHNDLPRYTITGVTGFGLMTNIPQGRIANNWQYQDTMTKVEGTHTFRFGGDFLRQIAAQDPPFNFRGSFSYAASTGVGAATALANFIDNFGGNGGSLNKQFGVARYRPNLFRQSYFFQDAWKVRSDLTLNLGLRYENFGTPVNFFTVAAFTNYDPVNFAAPHKVNADNNNFGPTVGFAWNPRGSSGWQHALFGDGKTVVRGGYQVTYDTWFNNLLSNIAGSSPNTLGGSIASIQNAANPRGSGNFSDQFAGITATPPTKESAQSSLFDPNIRNPYTYHYSLGVQREAPLGMIFDVSYVGTAGRKLFRTLDMNPIVNAATGDRLHPELQSPGTVNGLSHASQGVRSIRCACVNSRYDALQVNVKRRFSATPVGTMAVEGSYTWSHTFDAGSEAFATANTNSSFQSIAQVLGPQFSRVDYADSDLDRRQRLVMNFVWDVRGPKTGVLSYILGGWSLSGIPRWQTAAPFTMLNGTDRNSDGQAGPDRPDVGNPNAPLNTRATSVATSVCASGLRNIDTSACVTANDVHWIVGTGNPTAATIRRNSQRSNGFDIVDANVIKHFKIREGMDLQYRLEMFNALNTINFTGVPAVTVASSSSFYDFTQLAASGRTMRMALKFTW